MLSFVGNNVGNVAGQPLYICYAGYHLQSFAEPECAACPSGMYNKKPQLLLRCHFCDLGKYQSQQGQSSCTNCPEGFFGSIQGLSKKNCSGSCPKQTKCSGGCSSATPMLPGAVYSSSNGSAICKLFNDRRGCATLCVKGKAHVCDLKLMSGNVCGKNHGRDNHLVESHGSLASSR